jgi:hypothetical protein
MWFVVVIVAIAVVALGTLFLRRGRGRAVPGDADPGRRATPPQQPPHERPTN